VCVCVLGTLTINASWHKSGICGLDLCKDMYMCPMFVCVCRNSFRRCVHHVSVCRNSSICAPFLCVCVCVQEFISALRASR